MNPAGPWPEPEALTGATASLLGASGTQAFWAGQGGEAESEVAMAADGSQRKDRPKENDPKAVSQDGIH